MELAMKLLEIVPSDRTRLYSAMIRKQAEIRRSGRGTFLRAALVSSAEFKTVMAIDYIM